MQLRRREEKESAPQFSIALMYNTLLHCLIFDPGSSTRAVEWRREEAAERFTVKISPWTPLNGRSPSMVPLRKARQGQAPGSGESQEMSQKCKLVKRPHLAPHPLIKLD